MLQGMGLRAERAGNFASSARIVNPLLISLGGSHGVVVAAATKVKPKILRLKRDELAQVLPWSGSGEQRLQKLGTPSTWLARLAISLAGSVVFYNFNTTAAAVASLYWAWDPLLSTTFANTSLRLQYPYAGLWKAKVLDATVVMPVQRPRSDNVFQEVFESQPPGKPFLKLLIGDGSSASLEMKVGLPSKKSQQVRVGETVEVLVLSDIKSLSRFMAVRDVYLPDMDLWLSEEPCIERPVFENLIETLRTGSASPSPSSATPTLKSRDSQAVKARLPDSVDMIPGATLSNVSPEPQTARKWRLTQLDYEELPNEFNDDPKLQALRRITQRQQSQRRNAQAADGSYAPPPPRQYMEYSSDSEDRWEPENITPTNQAETTSSAVDEDYYYDAPTLDAKNANVVDDDRAVRRLEPNPKSRELPRSLRADAYGPPMQYMRMQEHGSEVEDRQEQSSDQSSAFSAGDEDPDAQMIPDESANSRPGEGELTTVDEFLGIGVNEVRRKVSDVELVREEEV